MKLKTMSLALMFLLATVCTAQNPGDAAPLFEAQALDGKMVKLEDFKGKVVVLDFWASWCVPCRAAFPVVIGLYNRHKDDSLVVLAVNLDTERGQAEKFLKDLKLDVPFSVLLDPESKIPPKYDLQGMPATIFIDGRGKIRFKHAGFEESYAEKYEKELMALLSELQGSAGEQSK